MENHSEFNKAGYTATQVACGWAGAIFDVTRAFGQEQYGQRIKNIKKTTERRTKRGVESRSTRQKRINSARIRSSTKKLQYLDLSHFKELFWTRPIWAL